MNWSPPRLRSDLIIRPQQTAQGTSVVIKSALSGKFFRLGEAEYFIAQQLDGETSLEVVRQRTEAKFGATLPVETLGAFIRSLKKNGILETTDARKQTPNRRERRFRGTFLYCRFKIFDPCRLLNRLVRRMGFFYTPYFGALSAAVILLAVGVTIANWSEFTLDIRRLYQLSVIPAVLALNFLIVGAHEFAHGLTCTRFGGEVHEMGAALIYLQPAFYCNVSDAWLFPEKSKRLWVGFAGPYFELFLWALATLAWRVTEPDSSVNFMALCVMATSGLKTLLNFNPLIKFDGYYLLSDYLEIPNLRRRSFRYVGTLLEKLFGFGPPDEAEENLTRRERRIFSIYGTLALVGSFSILGYILLTLGDSLVDGHAPAVLLVSLGLLGMRFRRRLRRMFGGPSASFDDDDFDSPDKASDMEEPGMPKETGYPQAQARTTGPREPEVRKSNGNGKALGGIPGPQMPSVAANGDPLETANSSVWTGDLLAAIYGRRIQTGLAHSTAAADPLRAEDHFEKSPKAASGDSLAVSKAGGPFVTPPQQSREGEAEAPKTKKSRSWKRWAPRIAWMALTAAAVIGLVFGQAQLRVTGPFSVLPIDNADVRAAVEGIIEEIYVDEGQSVRKGDVIARLSDKDFLQSELLKTEAEIRENRALLQKLVVGPTAAEIELARAGVSKAEEQLKVGMAAVSKAEDQLKYAQSRLPRFRQLLEESLTSQVEFEAAQQLAVVAENELAEAQSRLNVLANERAEAQGRLKVLLAGTRPEEIEATSARIERLGAQQRYLAEQLRHLDIVSPATGIIATPSRQLKEMNRQLAKKGDLIVKIYDLKTATVRIAVDEKDIADVKSGQKVVLRARAYPNEEFHGTVNLIATSVQASPSGNEPTSAPLVPLSSSSSNAKRTILVTTQVDNHSLLLKPEMTGQAKILCGRRRAIDLVTRRLARIVKVEFWSWW